MAITKGRGPIYAAARYEHEVNGLGIRKLANLFGVAASTFADWIRRDGWLRASKQVLVAETLAGKAVRAAHEGEVPMPGVTATMAYDAALTAGLRKALVERPRPKAKKTKSQIPDMPPRAKNGLVAMLDDEAESAEAHATAIGAETPPDTPPGSAFSATDDKSPIAGKATKTKVNQSTNVLPFPGVSMPSPPPEKPALGQMQVPSYTAAEKTQIKVTLGAIRAMMTLEQLQALNANEGVLRMYGHLLRCYLDPASVTDVEGLNEEEKAQKINAMQVIAMRQLLPTERDTLAGAIKTLTEALHRNIAMKRNLVGLAMPKGPHSGEADPTDSPALRAGIAAETLGTAELRKVSEAMELVQRRQQAQREAPKPPPPDPIDDLMDDAEDEPR